MKDLSLKELIRAVSEELLESRTERLAENRAPIFEVEELTLEVSFVVTDSVKGGGGFTIQVVKAEAGVSHDRQSIQKVTLKLKGIQDKGSVLTELGDELPLRPRSKDD